jgi:hypothetical protein
VAGTHDEAEIERRLDAIEALVARLRSGLRRADGRAGWRPDDASMWIEILEETKRDFERAPDKARDLWIVGGVARQLDAVGTTEGELAEALYSLAVELGSLDEEVGPAVDAQPGWRVSEREIEAVGAQDGPTRYEYFVKRAADREAVWSLGSDDELVSGTDEDGGTFLPLWPHPAYAERCRVGSWSDPEPCEISVYELLEELVPRLDRQGTKLGVFPLPDGNAVVVPPERLADDLLQELERYY